MFSSTMFAKEKAQSLINEFKTWASDTDKNGFQSDSEELKCAKKCALIAVEIAVTDLAFVIPKEAFKFWEQVKLEIESM